MQRSPTQPRRETHRNFRFFFDSPFDIAISHVRHSSLITRPYHTSGKNSSGDIFLPRPGIQAARVLSLIMRKVNTIINPMTGKWILLCATASLAVSAAGAESPVLGLREAVRISLDN